MFLQEIAEKFKVLQMKEQCEKKGENKNNEAIWTVEKRRWRNNNQLSVSGP
jgi:hypothetical protein